MAERIIEADKSIVLAADVQPEEFEGLMSELGPVEGLGGIKIGFELGLGLSLPTAVDIVRDNNPDLAVIYDHQKAGNDIPATGMNFGRTMERAGVDAAILFPFTGPVVEVQWIDELQDRGIGVIVGAEMTHEKIRESEDGYIADDAFMRMFAVAIDKGVRDFVVPGNKTEKVETYKYMFDKTIGEGSYTLWAPGFVDQGGDVTETGSLAGPRFHAIVGGGIYKAENPAEAATNLVSNLKAA